MAKVISFANQKGGVGKSTLCIQCAFYLTEAGNRVLVIDLDGQGNTSSRLVREKDGSDKEFYGTKTSELFNPALEEINPMICPRGMDLIHTPKNDPDLFEMEAASLDMAMMPSKNIHAHRLTDNYDYILIDCPPSLGRKLVAALTMSTHVVSPVQLSGFAVDGVEGLLNTIISVREAYNPDLEITGIVINNLNSRSGTHKKARQELLDAIPDLIFKSQIGSRAPIDNATNMGIPVWSIKSGSGRTAAKEVRSVMQEIVKKVG
ncbi:ParA family protein [Phytohalomonas tamaricis]|uniref:ParA family protein n=1 Tax=Phytohalomonas tamaricis TaxID=2081032 RepID=UPI000D0B4D99|nr:ParA family protein [Phytohalomonas tamaricis]